MKKIIAIEGMTCKHCAAAVEKSLKDIGIKAKVKLKENMAVYKDKGNVSDSEIKAAIENAGYTLVSIKND